MTPVSLTVSNDSKAYTVSGSGAIAGTVGLTNATAGWTFQLNPGTGYVTRASELTASEFNGMSLRPACVLDR